MAIIGTTLNVAGGAVDFFGKQKETKRQRDEAERAMREQAEAARKARASLPEYSLGRGARQALMMSQQDRAGDIARREAERAAASGLGALQSGGAKALIGGASSMARQQQESLARAAAESQARRQAGMDVFAGREQSVLDTNVAGARELGLFDYGRALTRADEAEAAREKARGQIAANRQNFIQDLFGAASGGLDVLGAAGASAKDGAKIKETPGEFSHKTNPIDLVRNGKKIGEATGGELIFNPEQSGKIERMASEGDSELHSYLRKLFREFNSKK